MLELGGAQRNTLDTVALARPGRVRGRPGVRRRRRAAPGGARARRTSTSSSCATCAGRCGRWPTCGRSSSCGVRSAASGRTSCTPTPPRPASSGGWRPVRAGADRHPLDPRLRLRRPPAGAGARRVPRRRADGVALDDRVHRGVAAQPRGGRAARPVPGRASAGDPLGDRPGRRFAAHRGGEAVRRGARYSRGGAARGPDRVLQAAEGAGALRRARRALASRFPDAHFLLAGDGALRRRLERLRREAGLERRLHLPGWRRTCRRSSTPPPS